MADENKQGQVVTDQTGVTGQVAADNKGVTQQVAAAQEIAPVPYDRFKEVNEQKNEAEKKLAEAEKRQAELEFQMRLAAMPQQSQQQPSQPAANQRFADDDIITGRQLKEVLSEQSSIINKTVQQNVFLAQHPDFAQLVGAPNAMGQFMPSAFLQEAIKKDPNLIIEAQLSPHGYRDLYRVAKYEKELAARIAAQQQNVQQQTQQNINAATQPLSPAAIGGGGALPNAGSAPMSDQEFEETDRKVMSGQLG